MIIKKAVIVVSFIFFMCTSFGCAVHEWMIKNDRRSSNEGYVVKNMNDVTVRMAAAKVLQNKGYTIKSYGKYVRGKKVQKAEDKGLQDLATQTVFGMFGVKSKDNSNTQVKDRSEEEVTVSCTLQWDNNFEHPTNPPAAVINVYGSTYDVDTKEKSYNEGEINTMDLNTIRNEIIAMAKANYR